MNLRLYMRGLGIGILVTAAVLTLTDNNVEAMTDDEIRAKARTLGMIENVVLSQMARDDAEDANAENDEEVNAAADALKEGDEPLAIPNPPLMPKISLDFNGEISYADILDEESETLTMPDVASELISEPEAEAEIEAELEAETESISGSEAEVALNQEAEAELSTEPGETIMIRVNSGDDSFRVCTRLENAGLVAVASDYNQYLMNNGYSRSLRVGNHTIPKDADYKTIALILTGRTN